ncbi:hypothetical protein [Desulfitobacterium dehalogenans]|nr:hypothetical protein [Desulfitobacterium dehalogenans]
MVFLGAVFILRSGLYLSPLSAHENSERSIHYGPSKVVHMEDFDKGKYILGKYDRWVSCNTVRKELLFFWSFGNNPIGFENDPTEIIDYTIDGFHDDDHYDFKLYGIVNDPRIKKVEIILRDGKVLTQTEFYGDLFLITWRTNDYTSDWGLEEVRGYGEGDSILFRAENEVY